MVELKQHDKEILSSLKTESRNPKTLELDLISTHELLEIMNEEDKRVIDAVRKVLPKVEQTIHQVILALENGGRLVYAGAGTSGRLGILDAVECVPTFSTTDEVIGIIAGGEKAFVRAQEGVEDSPEAAAADLKAVHLTDLDVVVALTASGRTPYCIGALQYARSVGAFCVGLSCNSPAELSAYADISIEVDAGPEILTGSTRLKSGTAEKMILNMISTASMVGIGKVYGNLMVDMKATNLKLAERADASYAWHADATPKKPAKHYTRRAENMKTAIVMIQSGVSREEAEQRLLKHKGFVRKCI